MLGCDSPKSPASRAYSYSIDDSKSKGVFQFEAACGKPAFLLDSLYKCDIKKAWVENLWNKQVMTFGKSKVLKFDSLYQLIIQLNITPFAIKQKNKYFYFIGNNPLDTFITFRCKLNGIDSIKIPIYKQEDSTCLSEKQKAFDTLLFLKKISI